MAWLGLWLCHNPNHAIHIYSHLFCGVYNLMQARKIEAIGED